MGPAYPSVMKATVAKRGEEPTDRKLRMRVRRGLVRHSGAPQMYARSGPRAIAELVANAWDADARERLDRDPLDEPSRHELGDPGRDDGVGMTFDEANDLYLAVGRDRRVSGPTYTAGGRPVMGRKGLGSSQGSALPLWSKSGR